MHAGVRCYVVLCLAITSVYSGYLCLVLYYLQGETSMHAGVRCYVVLCLAITSVYSRQDNTRGDKAGQDRN